MAFDISTARPNQPSGFDLSTAKPAQQSIDRNIMAQAQQKNPALVPKPDTSVGTFIEPALAMVTGAIAEPIAGVAGIAQSVNPFAAPGAGAQAVESTREALTFQPRTAAGKEGLLAVGGALEPIGEAIHAVEKGAGDLAFEHTGSPLVASIATAVPTAILSALGVKKTPKGAPDISPQRAREIQQVLVASEKQGIDVLTSDLFQPKSILSRLTRQFSERVPILGTGGKRAAQQEQRIAAIERLDQSVPRVESADIFASLEANANKTRIAAGKRINSTVESMETFGQVPVSNTVARIDKALERLNAPTKIANPALVSELENLKTTVLNEGQTFKTLREFRTDARSIADSVDPLGRSQLRTSDKALMDSVVKGVTDDLDAFVLSNSDARGLSRYKSADAVYRQEALKLTKSRLKSVLDKGEVKPELVNNLLFSSSPSEVRLLFNNLDAGGRQNARMALYRKALDNAKRGDEISPQRFSSELGKMEKNFDVFFRGEAKAEVNGLKRLLETTDRAGAVGVVTPTGQALQIPATTAVLAGAAVGNPAAIGTVLGASTVGLGSRVFESAGVRNMLIQLGKAPKRSTLETSLIRALPLMLEEAGRGIAREEQAKQNSLEQPQSGQ